MSYPALLVLAYYYEANLWLRILEHMLLAPQFAILLDTVRTNILSKLLMMFIPLVAMTSFTFSHDYNAVHYASHLWNLISGDSFTD